MAYNERVSVTIVTYNSGRFIKRCLESVLAQKYIAAKRSLLSITLPTTERWTFWSNLKTAARLFTTMRISGFAAAQNQAIALSRGDWVLTLNPDVLLLPNFIQSLVDAGQMDKRIGTVCGKLLAILATFDLPEKPLVDSTGIYFTPMLRHLDRGSQEVDNGHYLHHEYVFGATAAAALYRRTMIEDVAIQGEFFDEEFFVYREDADVAWRAQLLGWRCMYTPHARGYHVRNVLPGNRRALPSVINMHSVKNRFLMRLKNMTGDLYRRNWLAITTRDVVVLGCCLVREHSSLKAFWYVAKNWKRVMAKRREIMSRKCVDDDYMASWFHYEPVSHPAKTKGRARDASVRQ